MSGPAELKKVMSIASKFDRQASEAMGDGTAEANVPAQRRLPKISSKKLAQKQAESVRTTVEIVRSAEPGPDGRSGVGIHYARKASTDDSEPYTITGFVHGSPAAKLNKDRPDLIQIGQQLHEVDGKSLTGLSIEQVRSLILGEPGSRVKVTVLQPEDAEMQKSAAGLRAKAGQGSVQDILQLFKDADISEFVLMSRESSVAINPEAKSSDFLEQTDSEKGSSEEKQPLWKVTSQLGFVSTAIPPPMSSGGEDLEASCGDSRLPLSFGRMSILQSSFIIPRSAEATQKAQQQSISDKEASQDLPDLLVRTESQGVPPENTPMPGRFLAKPPPPILLAIGSDADDAREREVHEDDGATKMVVRCETSSPELVRTPDGSWGGGQGGVPNEQKEETINAEGLEGEEVRGGEQREVDVLASSLKKQKEWEDADTIFEATNFDTFPEESQKRDLEGLMISRPMRAASPHLSAAKVSVPTTRKDHKKHARLRCLSRRAEMDDANDQTQGINKMPVARKVGVAQILAISGLGDGVGGVYIELRVQEASAFGRSRVLAAGNSLIHVNQSVKVSVPAEMGMKARMELAVVESQSRRDIGNIIFPLDKVAASQTTVQGWYKLVQEGMMRDDETQTEVCIKCKMSVEDVDTIEDGEANPAIFPVPPGTVYRPSRVLKTNPMLDDKADGFGIKQAGLADLGNALARRTPASGRAGHPDSCGIGIALLQQWGIWFVHELLPGGAAARSSCIKVGDQLCAIEHAQTGSFPPHQLLVGADTSLEEVSEIMKGPQGSFVKLTLARGGSFVYSVMLMRGHQEKRPEIEDSGRARDRRIRSKADGVALKTRRKGKSSPSDAASFGCVSFMNLKPTPAPKLRKSSVDANDLQAGQQVLVVRDTHTHQGRVHPAGELMIFEREGSNGWTYVRDAQGAYYWMPSKTLAAAGGMGAGEQQPRRHRTKKVASSSTAKASRGDHFSPVVKHHVSPGIPPALSPLPRTPHVVWDDEVVNNHHTEPWHHPDQHYTSSYHSKEFTGRHSQERPCSLPLTHLTTTPRESHHFLSQSSHDNNPASQAVFKALIHEFSSPRHSNASRYLTRSEWHDSTTLDSNLQAAEPIGGVLQENVGDVGTPRPRLALSPHQLLFEMRSGEPDSGHRMLMARAGSEREKNMLLV